MFLRNLNALRGYYEAVVDGEGSAGGEPAGDATGGQPDPDADGGTPDGGTPAADPNRPEGLEDSFWDAEKGEVRLDSLIKSHNDTKAAFSKKEEAIREKLIAEQQGNRPENPEAYTVGELGIDVPDGYDVSIPDGDPLMGVWRNIAFQNNLSQDQFMEGVRTFVKGQLETRVDPAAEKAKLGENADARVARLDAVLTKHLSPEENNLISDLLDTGEAVMAFEKLITAIGQSRLPDIDVPPGDGGLTLDELRNMQSDPRYWQQKDPAYIKRVEDGYRKLYPGTYRKDG